MSNKRYYWLKLKEDFFEEDTIAWIEEQPNGKEYSLFYLKLCLKSLKTNGILVRNVGEILIPYDSKTLAKITNTDIDTVMVSMELFKKIGLIQVLDNGEIFLTQLENMVGSETKWAEKKRNQRKKLSNISNEDNVLLLSSESPREKEKEKDLESELDLDLEEERNEKKYGKYKNVILTDDEYNKLKDEFPKDYEQRIEKLSMYIKSKGANYENHLATIELWASKEQKEEQDTSYDLNGYNKFTESQEYFNLLAHSFDKE